MCEHRNVKPILFLNEEGKKEIDVLVCLDCFKEFAVSPMTLGQYRNLERIQEINNINGGHNGVFQ